MQIIVNESEINYMLGHIINRSNIFSFFKVIDYKDIKVYFYYRNDMYNVVFKTKKVDIIKYFTLDSEIEFTEYDEILFEEIDEMFSFSILERKNYKKFSDFRKLENYILKVYFYLYDNEL